MTTPENSPSPPHGLSASREPRIRPLKVIGLGQWVAIQFQGSAAAIASSNAHEVWKDATLPSDSDTDHELHVLMHDADSLTLTLESLSSRITFAGIERLSEHHLLLHAAGLAHPTTHVVLACIAPSGTGKTTISRNAAGKLHYVSDETVAITDQGGVISYPKPLSVKKPQNEDPEAKLPKEQIPASSLGLTIAPAEGLVIGGVVLLDRIREPNGSETPHLTPLTLFEAILRIVPEVSYLPRLERPLHRLAELILRTGGAHSLVYPDAGEAIDHLIAHHPAYSSPPVLWNTPTPVEILESQAEVDYWRQTLDEVRAEEPPGPQYQIVGEFNDLLLDVHAPQALVLSNGLVTQVNPIAAGILFAAQEPIGSASLAKFIYEIFGEPPAGADPLPLFLDELLNAGLLTKVTRETRVESTPVEGSPAGAASPEA